MLAFYSQFDLWQVFLYHPEIITHLATEYSLKHMWKRTDSFDWQRTTGETVGFDVVTTFADHCYTDEQLPFEQGCYTVKGKLRDRVFCTDRYARSKQLPQLISSLITKPGTGVNLTQDRNWMNLVLVMTPPLKRGDRYYIFFHVKGTDVQADGRHKVTLYVESAYAREVRIDVKRRAPFGRVVEEVVFGI